MATNIDAGYHLKKPSLPALPRGVTLVHGRVRSVDGSQLAEIYWYSSSMNLPGYIVFPASRRIVFYTRQSV